MGRAIVREPAVFLFDEPLSNLDAKLRVQMRLEIRQLQQRLGTTSIYVTHDQVEAMTLGDRLMVMNGGIVEQIGAPLEVYALPASTFVAGFIGSPAMNFLDATISDDGREAVLGTDRLTLPTPRPAEANRPVTLGLRPEHLAPSEAGQRALHLEISLVEALGADTVVHGRMAGNGADLAARLTGTTVVRMGDRIALTAPPSQLHLFDRTNGKRL
jgi:sn-glycerol 3-phosphate transport system ATP-binding protein